MPAHHILSKLRGDKYGGSIIIFTVYHDTGYNIIARVCRKLISQYPIIEYKDCPHQRQQFVHQLGTKT